MDICNWCLKPVPEEYSNLAKGWHDDCVDKLVKFMEALEDLND